MLAARARYLSRIAALAAILAIAPSARGDIFQSAHREGGSIHLLTHTGEVWTAGKAGSVSRALRLTAPNGAAHRWERPPLSIARFGSSWLVADGSDHLLRFDAAGRFARRVPLPARVSTIAGSAGVIWAVNLFARDSATQLLRSIDGTSFEWFAPRSTRRTFDTPAENLLILGPGSAGEIYTARIIAPPVVSRAKGSMAGSFAVAYSRTRDRSSLETVSAPLDDVTHYSLPVRDLLPLKDGAIAVLRNREDVSGRGGSFELMLGRRADLYDASGRHVKTATFARSVHWLFAPTPTSIRGISRDGTIESAAWGPPEPGGIVRR